MRGRHRHAHPAEHARPLPSRWSWRSNGSILCIASEGSILSIGSVGSIGSIGSFGSACSVLSVGSAASAASILSAASWRSVMSASASHSIMGRPLGSTERRIVALGALALATAILKR